MLGSIGPLEIGIILVIALLVFGAKKLPELGGGLGRGMREFKEGVVGEKEAGADGGATLTPQVAAPEVDAPADTEVRADAG